MTYLLSKYYSSYHLYSPDVYGMGTWGSNNQDGLEKRGKSWYITSWHAGDEWHDDREYEFKLNVALETQNLSEVIKYIEEHNPKQIKLIIEEANEILSFKEKFDEWVGGKK